MNYSVNNGTSLESFETLGDWTASGTGATIASDTDHYKVGSAALKLTSVNAVSAYATKSVTWDFSSVDRFSIWVYVDDINKYARTSQGLVYLYSGSDYYLYTINTRRLYTGWNKFVFSKIDFTSSGSPNWASIDSIKIRCVSLTGQTVSMTFSDLRTNAYARPKVIFTFDDGNTTDYTQAFAYMKPRKMKGTLFIYGSVVDGAGKITTAQLDEMYADGWDISNHTWTGETLEGKTQAEVTSALTTNSDFINSKGWTRNNCAYYLGYPLSYTDPTVVLGVIDAGIVAGRSGYPATEAHDNAHKMIIARREPLSTSSIADITGWIDNATANGGAVFLNWHVITATPSVDTDVLPETFAAVVDYCNKYNGILLDVVTISEWYNGLSNPRLSV